jgi:hypothetical protein
MTKKTWISMFATVLFAGPAAAQIYSTTPTYTTTTTPTYKMYGSGPQYNRVEGDITATPTLPPFNTGIKLENRVLTITGGSADDAGWVMPSGSDVVAARGTFRSTFPASSVDKIVFYGNAGNDHFDNRTPIPSEAYGGDGNDILSGGSGIDFLVGGLGNDTVKGNDGNDVLWGSGGHDAVYGGNGNDWLKGHGGDDFLYGEYGDDSLYGGSGVDELSGSYGTDTLVSIGGGVDTVVGGTNNDYFWVDTVDELISVTATETDGHYVNKVPRFYSYSYDGGATSTTVAKDLTNTDLADPIAHNSSDTLVDYSTRALFSSAGPTAEDMIQGSADDCFILGPLSAVARQTPDSIRKLVVDLDDETYAVRFYRDSLGAAEYVRVDGELYESSAGNLRYARLGPQNSLWPAIVEKAFAFYRNKLGTYASIDGGNNGTGGSIIMRATKEVYSIPELYNEHDVVDWIADGRPNNAVASYINGQVPALLNWISDRLDEGRPVYTGYTPGTLDTTALTTSNWRRGTHIIMIDRVLFDANGNPTGLVIRDQVGPREREYRDFAHIFHVFGRANTYDMP